jgi:segregation and condensation protein B
MLMERKLIRVLGRKEIPGRPLIYATTKRFLEVFELKDLKDLPTPKEIEELGKSRLEDASEIENSAVDQPAVAVSVADIASADQAIAGNGDSQPDSANPQASDPPGEKFS